MTRRLSHLYAALGVVILIPATIALWLNAGVWAVANACAFVLIAAAHITMTAARDGERLERLLAERQRDQARRELAEERIDKSGSWIFTPLFGKAAAINGGGRRSA